jgi:thiamine-monophosphate kinase
MSGADPPTPPDEFGQIAEFFRPLTRGDPGAFDLLDDAAVAPIQAGADLVLTQDAMVEGVHFPPGEAAEDVAARFIRVNLSDLAAKGAEPFAWLQTLAWGPDWPLERRRAFARGLAIESERFGLTLLGGDTVSTPGPFMVSGAFLGRCPSGGMVLRSGARPGHLLLASGAIGDGWLGLQAVTRGLEDPSGRLAGKFRRPEPRLDLRAVLRACASASADVSDGLIADAGHLARASGCGVRVELERVPLSAEGRNWLLRQADRAVALTTLASGGDDYELVLAAPVEKAAGLQAAGCTVIGGFVDGPSGVFLEGRELVVGAGGWRHG